ncbi:hypothetical protein PUNSTDRAFT_146285 [Punctularia strigosozonata HHB-11173 SS5]|uniref:Uncharacterized protein n=1 Tax=Punctularia strigosozonata (strain HHB-11173) TaxID=741275 RepID=R7S479_PUNST|nr:uncharacterized protein PUNSTDRAFT_146285 [Punctularia strigosozonata HHB-11173 SS5]EIN04602.1 hypothetical protein PUNSTDRAFT_146285 [Punctularia strigosozonata HHB-11173 SS5]
MPTTSIPSSSPEMSPKLPPSPPQAHSPPATSLASSPDLRKLTSATNLAPGPSPQKQRSLSPRNSIHMGRGTRSPNDSSIPSSPTSIHSSSSAIFERDVEPLPLPSLTPSTNPPVHAGGAPSPVHGGFDKQSIHGPNPHLMPRGKATEQLEQSVPSVLDQAATLLTASGPDEEDQIAVVTPATSGSIAASMLAPSTSSIRTGPGMPERQPSPILDTSPVAAYNKAWQPTLAHHTSTLQAIAQGMGEGAMLSSRGAPRRERRVVPPPGAGFRPRGAMPIQTAVAPAATSPSTSAMTSPLSGTPPISPSSFGMASYPSIGQAAAGHSTNSTATMRDFAYSPSSILAGTASRSRSPSPMGLRAGQRQSLLLNFPGSPSSTPTSPVSNASQPASPPTRPVIHTQQTITPMTRATSQPGSQVASTPTSAYYSAASSESGSPTTTTMENAPTLPTPTPAQTGFAASSSPLVGSRPSRSPQRRTSTLLSVSPTSPPLTGIPPSPNTSNASKRLSFISYADLLTSAPANTLSLSQLTHNATTEPPPHIPSVVNAIGVSSQGGSDYGSTVPRSGTASSASSLHRLSGIMPGSIPLHGHGFGASSHAAMSKRESVLLDDVGGEFEREGFGTGLEERLEAVIGGTPPLSGNASAVNAKA